MTLTHFLLARTDDDERVARFALSMLATPTAKREGARLSLTSPDTVNVGISVFGRPVYNPATDLARCDATRQVIALHSIDFWVGSDGDDEYFCAGCTGAGTAATPDEVICPTLAALATVYAAHPDHRDVWSFEAAANHV